MAEGNREALSTGLPRTGRFEVAGMLWVVIWRMTVWARKEEKPSVT